MPSKQLFDGMKMTHADKEGVFLNGDGNVICFDAGATDNNSKNYLLVRKDILLDYLKTHNKKIIWYVLGEKNIIGLHTCNSELSWLIVSGTYTLDKDGKIVGNLRASRERE